MSELNELMSEPAGGPNHGRGRRGGSAPDARAGTTDYNSWRDLDVKDMPINDFLAAGGWIVVERGRGGTSAHRGAVHPGEFVDEDVLRLKLEKHMGFTVQDAHIAYRRDVLGGPVPITLRELRGRLDARLLALSREGVNMDGLAQVLDIHPMQFKRALSRARGKE